MIYLDNRTVELDNEELLLRDTFEGFLDEGYSIPAAVAKVERAAGRLPEEFRDYLLTINSDTLPSSAEAIRGEVETALVEGSFTDFSSCLLDADPDAMPDAMVFIAAVDDPR